MNYQQVPFYIWSDDHDISKKLATILGRKSNTRIEALNREKFFSDVNECETFTAFVLHFKNRTPALIEMINALNRKNPFFPIFLVSFSEVSNDLYRELIRIGVTDILYHKSDNPFSVIQKELLTSINTKWRGYKTLFRERNKILKATIVTAHHEINQPLTVILNSVGLLNMEIKKPTINTMNIKKYFGFIVRGANRIQAILDELKKVENPRLKEYTTGVPMLDLWQSQKQNKADLGIKETNLENGILIIGSENETVCQLDEDLESMGFQPIRTSSLADANPVINRALNQLQAIILDVDDREVEAENMFFELKLHSIHIPIIILSHDAQNPLVTHLMDEGAHALISKPINTGELIKVLSDAPHITV